MLNRGAKYGREMFLIDITCANNARILICDITEIN